MIDVKDVVMLSGLVQPSNSTFYSERISHKGSPIFLDVHSLVGRYCSNQIATPQYEDHVTGVRPSIHGGLLRG